VILETDADCAAVYVLFRGDLSGWFPSAAGKPTSQSAEKRGRLFVLHTGALRQLMFVLVSLMDENEINLHLRPDEIPQLHLNREILRAVFLQTLHHGFEECQIRQAIQTSRATTVAVFSWIFSKRNTQHSLTKPSKENYGDCSRPTYQMFRSADGGGCAFV
jgi:hypothetical protein